DGAAITRVHIASWRVAYRGHLPAELLAGLSVERRAERWREIVGRADSPTFIAEAEGEVVGFAGIGPSRESPDASPRRARPSAEGRAGELYSIYVDPAHFG